MSFLSFYFKFLFSGLNPQSNILDNDVSMNPMPPSQVFS